MKNDGKVRRDPDGFVAVMVLSVALILIGALSLLYPDTIRFELVCQVAGAVAIVAGLILIVRYLYRQEYRNVTNYDLAIGLVVASAGLCVIVNSESISGYYLTLMGILALLEAVVMIQHALAIRIMDGKLFPLAAVIAAGVYFFAMFTIINPGGFFIFQSALFSSLVCLSGIFGLFTMFLAWMRGRDLLREEERDAARIMEDEPVAEGASITENAGDDDIIETYDGDVIEQEALISKDLPAQLPEGTDLQ